MRTGKTSASLKQTFSELPSAYCESSMSWTPKGLLAAGCMEACCQITRLALGGRVEGSPHLGQECVNEASGGSQKEYQERFFQLPGLGCRPRVASQAAEAAIPVQAACQEEEVPESAAPKHHSRPARQGEASREVEVQESAAPKLAAAGAAVTAQKRCRTTEVWGPRVPGPHVGAENTEQHDQTAGAACGYGDALPQVGPEEGIWVASAVTHSGTGRQVQGCKNKTFL